MAADRLDKDVAHSDEAVIEPRCSKLDPRIHDPVILVPVWPLSETVARSYRARRSVRPFFPARIYTVKQKKRRLTLAGPCMGAPAAVFVLERLWACGARRVVMLGFCGSISQELKIGDLVVPDWGIIEEGTSQHYVTGAKRSAPTKRALAALESALAEAGRSYHLGPVWTTDAVFRETRAKVRSMAQQGALAVEMETSALFTVARFRGMELAALLVVSDELRERGWRPGFTRRRFITACGHAGRLALAAANKLSEEPL